MAARTAREALVSAGDVIERTTDGGASWTVLFAGMNGHRGTVRDLEWVTGTVAYAATLERWLQRLANAGRSPRTLAAYRADLDDTMATVAVGCFLSTIEK